MAIQHIDRSHLSHSVQTVIPLRQCVLHDCYTFSKKCIRSIVVKTFIGPHHRYQVLGIAEVDDVMGVPRQHVYRLDLPNRNPEFQHLVCADLPLLNEGLSAHHYKEFPLSVVPILSLSDACYPLSRNYIQPANPSIMILFLFFLK